MNEPSFFFGVFIGAAVTLILTTAIHLALTTREYARVQHGRDTVELRFRWNGVVWWGVAYMAWTYTIDPKTGECWRLGETRPTPWVALTPRLSSIYKAPGVVP